MAETFKVLIIDDEELGRRIVRKYLAEFPGFQLLGEASNGFQGLKLIQENEPDIIFLDIQMPKITGFELLELLDKPVSVIFTTAYDQYAVQAFEANAIDYLLKPFSQARFNQALEKFLSQNRQTLQTQIENLKTYVESEKKILDRLPVKDGSKIHILQLQDIVYIEAQDDYIQIKTETAKFLKKQTMKAIEERLPPEQFIRIHRSYLVNVKYIKEIELFEKETYRVKLINGQSLEVSKSGYQNLSKILA